MSASSFFRLCIHHGPDVERCDRCVDEALDYLAREKSAEENEHRLTYAALGEADAKIESYERSLNAAREMACTFAFFLGLAEGTANGASVPRSPVSGPVGAAAIRGVR